MNVEFVTDKTRKKRDVMKKNVSLYTCNLSVFLPFLRKLTLFDCFDFRIDVLYETFHIKRRRDGETQLSLPVSTMSTWCAWPRCVLWEDRVTGISLGTPRKSRLFYLWNRVLADNGGFSRFFTHLSGIYEYTRCYCQSV